MTRKPEKVGDRKQKQKKLNEKMNMKKKAVNSFLPPYTGIFCEGEKTEPLYFSAFADKINRKYARISSRPRIDINGLGTGCHNLEEMAALQNPDDFYKLERIWFVYDKDDFAKQDFDKLYFSCIGDNTHRKAAAWSNECIELWFLLHFQELHSALDRHQIMKLLQSHMDYRKNDPDTFAVLEPHMQDAIRRAEKLLSEYPRNTAPSGINPGTNVVELVKELLSYL